MKSCPPQADPGPTDQPLGEGDGASRRFALTKTYGAGGDAYLRPIALPVSGTLRVAVGGVEAGAGDVSFDAASGEVVFAEGAEPADGEAVTAGYEFDVPVRFDADRLVLSLTAFEAGQIPTVALLEVLL